MSIEFKCSGCENTLRVSDAYAGMNAQCPKCGAESQVPSGAPSTVAEASYDDDKEAETAAAADPLENQAVWQMETSGGQRYGPVARPALNQWLAEGRIDARCRIFREGWDDWKPAADIFPQLAAKPGSAANPYQSPTSQSPNPYQYVQPHRGPLVLSLGILSLMTCQLFGIAAWVMGRADLAAMREGRMDRSGEGITQAGYVCGIISTVMVLGSVALGLIWLMFMFVFLGAAAAGS